MWGEGPSADAATLPQHTRGTTAMRHHTPRKESRPPVDTQLTVAAAHRLLSHRAAERGDHALAQEMDGMPRWPGAASPGGLLRTLDWFCTAVFAVTGCVTAALSGMDVCAPTRSPCARSSGQHPHPCRTRVACKPPCSV